MDPSGRVVFGGYGYLGSVSNNVAEFTAFAAACQWVAESGLASATVLGDSELVADAFRREKDFALTGAAPSDGGGQRRGWPCMCGTRPAP
jgi:ribonuclease HI